MEAQLCLTALRRFWWLVLLGPVLAGAAAYFYSNSLTPIYRTSSTLLVSQTQNPGVIQYNDILTSERLTNTYAELLQRQAVLSNVIASLDLEMTTDDLAKKVSVSVVRNTQLLRISVEDPSPELAASIANTLGEAFIAENVESLDSAQGVSIADGARVPDSPAKPNVQLNTILAAMLGVMVVSGLAVLYEFLDDTLKAGDETEMAFGVPTLGSIRRLDTRRDGPQPLNTFAGVDAYTQLRTNVHFAGLGKPLQKLVITGSLPGEGKSTTAAGLAIALAQAGQKVVLVDGDLRRPTLHQIFGLSNSFGITGLLLSRADDPTPALMATPHKNLVVLPSGPAPANPADLLMSHLWQQLVARLCEISNYVIFDSPPVLSATDATILAGRAHGTIVVAEAGRTRRGAIRRALEDLRQTKADVLGIVKNKVKSKEAGYYYGYYGGLSEKGKPTEGAAQGRPAAIAAGRPVRSLGQRRGERSA